MTARVETYVGAGGKTTSIFPGPDGTEIGKKGGHRYDDTYDAARIVVYFQRPSRRLAGRVAA